MSISPMREAAYRVVIISAVSFAFVAASVPPAALSECSNGWLPSEGAPGVVGDATVFASTLWDPDLDGPKPPLLVFGGTFVTAGNLSVQAVAAWDGAEWHALGAGLPAQVRALTVFNGDLVAAAGNSTFGGSGPANGVARWTGTEWVAVGMGGFQSAVRCLAVYQGELIAGGFFNSAGGTPVNNIARWNGSAWQPLGGGITGAANAMIVHDGELVVAGVISSAGGTSTTNVARWNGTSWQAMGAIAGGVNALAFHNGKLHASSSAVFRWDGAAWQQLGAAMNHSVNSLAEFNGELIAGGLFTSVGGVGAFRMARWNGAGWSAVPPGLGMPDRRCDTLAVFNNALFAGGARSRPSGTQAENVGRWDGDGWSYLGGGIDNAVLDVVSFGGELVAGGYFVTAGDTVVNGIAARGDDGWHRLGPQGLTGNPGVVIDLAVYNGDLLATGSFSAIGGVPANGMARWDGETWHAFGHQAVNRMLVHEGELYACGAWGDARVARWDAASEMWQPLGSLPHNGIFSLTIFNNDLIAGGFAGIGAPASVYRWDGTAWQPLGGPLGSSIVHALAVFNGDLIAGGEAGVPGGIARWTGAAWTSLQGGISHSEYPLVLSLRVFDGELVVGGQFNFVGAGVTNITSNHVARWNGSTWLPMGTGSNDAVVALDVHHGELIVSGWFDLLNGGPGGHIGRWGAIPCARGDANCDQLIDTADIPAFVDALLNPLALEACLLPAVDANSDGLLNGMDVQAFCDCVLAGACP